MAQYSSVPPPPFSPNDTAPSMAPTYAPQLSMADPKQAYASSHGYSGPPSETMTSGHLRQERAGGHAKSFRYMGTWFMESFWVIEIAACIVAVALHIFTYMLLRDYNGKNVAEFRGRWSLNSIVALLVTVVKIAAILPVAGCIGQLKWRRFRNFRRLRDMEYFDMASRGMFGSLRLLLHLRFWHWACLGALITIGAVAMDTLAQNVITIDQGLVKLDGTLPLSLNNAAAIVQNGKYTAAIARSRKYYNFFQYAFPIEENLESAWPAAGMTSMINYGMSFTTSPFDSTPTPSFTCTTGNCTFEPYQSLEITSVCLDWTEYVRNISSQGYWASLPGDDSPILANESQRINITATTDYNTSLYTHPLEHGPLVLNWQAVANTSEGNLTAIQCLFYWGVSTYNTTVTNGVLDRNITDFWTNTSAEAKTVWAQPQNITLRPPQCYVNGTLVADSSKVDECLYEVQHDAQRGLQNYLMTHFSGYYKETTYSEYSTGFLNDIYQAIDNAGTYWQIPYEGLQNTAEATSVMMNQGIAKMWVLNETTSEAVGRIENGTVLQWQSTFRMRYQYMALNHFVVGGSVIFFLVSVIMCRKDEVKKNSVLPYMFHGFTPDARATLDENPRHADMKYAAEELEVRFAMTPGGKRLGTKQTLGPGV